jgi:hypothetical protein
MHAKDCSVESCERVVLCLVRKIVIVIKRSHESCVAHVP